MVPLSTQPLLEPGFVPGSPDTLGQATLQEQHGAFPSHVPAQEGHQDTGAMALQRWSIPTPLQSSVRRQTTVPSSHPMLQASGHEGMRKRGEWEEGMQRGPLSPPS